MNVSKTLKEYIEQTVDDKIRKKQAEAQQKEDGIFEKIRPKLDKLYSEHVEKARKVLTDAGLDPDIWGYREGSSACGVPRYIFPYRGIRGSQRYKNVQDILVKIELDEIPKDKIREFIDNYEVTIDVDD